MDVRCVHYDLVMKVQDRVLVQRCRSHQELVALQFLTVLGFCGSRIFLSFGSSGFCSLLCLSGRRFSGLQILNPYFSLVNTFEECLVAGLLG